MNIALDYDETFTRDPELWASLARAAVSRGHDVRIVTFRNSRGNNDDLHLQLSHFLPDIPIIFTEHLSKRYYCQNILQWFPHVWIDDMPELIPYDGRTVTEDMIDKQLKYQETNDDF